MKPMSEVIAEMVARELGDDVATVTPEGAWTREGEANTVWAIHDGTLSAVVSEEGGVLNGPRPPKREGWTCFFVARHGTYSRFSYKPVLEESS